MPTLLPYQLIGKEFLKSKKIAFLGDVMGLGKSCQAITAAGELIRDKVVKDTVLIVCPAILTLNWMNELEKWGATYNVTISSYASLHKVQGKFDVVIADEAHKLKNPKAKRTVRFYSLAAKARRVWLLSGTPITRCTTDLHPFLSFAGIYPGNWHQFADRYAQKSLLRARGRLIKQYKGGKNLKELKELMSTIMLRRFKRDVLKELPDKIHNEILLSREATAKYEPYLDDVEYLLEDQSPPSTMSSDDKIAIATLRKDLGVSKVQDAIKFAYSITEDTDEQIIFFAHHREVFKRLADSLEAIGATFGMLVGGQKDTERKDILEAWKRGNIQYLILSLEAASTGLNLVESSKAIFVELPWNPSTLDQSIGRIHRIGQKEVTNIYFLLRGNSFDRAVKRTILSKRSVIHETVGSEK